MLRNRNNKNIEIEKKEAMLTSLKKRLIEAEIFTDEEPENFLHVSSLSAQHLLAQKLRNAAIAHLKTGKGVVAEGFRDEFSAVSSTKCALIVTPTPPRLDTIDNLPIQSHTKAYVRSNDQLFYIDTENKTCIDLKVNKERLASFDKSLQPTKTVKSLTKNEIKTAELIIDPHAVTYLPDDQNNFLKEQVKPGEWATYIEATALGEKLGCNVVVIKKDTKEETTQCLYRASKEAPTIHLYNSGYTHWYVNGETMDDGNCLYNAFAQALQHLLQANRSVKKSIPAPAPAPAPLKQTSNTLEQHTLFKSSSFTIPDYIIDQNQIKILEAIQKQPTPEEMRKTCEEQYQKDCERLSKMDQKEREKIEKQIREDRALALQIAREENVISNRISR